MLRSALLLGGGALLGGCDLLGGQGGADDEAGPDREGGEPRPEVAALTAALRDEEALLAALGAAVARHPGLAPRLTPVAGEHAEHRRVLATLLTGLGAGAPSASPGPTPLPVPGGTDASSDAGDSDTGDSDTDTGDSDAGDTDAEGPDGPPVPDDPGQALAGLAALERQAASARSEQAVTASARWAPLLGVLAASEATHAAVLLP